MYSTTSQTDGQQRKEDAARWVALTDERTLLPDEQKQLDNWLQADTRNLGAFVRAKSIYHALDYRSSRHINTAPIPTPSQSLSRRHFLTAACAAGVATLVTPKTTTEYFSLRHRGRQAPQRYEWHGNQIIVDARSGAYFSSTQHHDAILIADGRIGLQIQRRLLHVTVGTMWFASKKADFDISVLGSEVMVSLYSGTLNWKSYDKSSKFTSPNIILFSQGSKNTPVLVNKKILPDDDAVTRKAWRNGQIIMNNYTLTEAVNEFNRYSDVQCLIVSPNLGQRRLSGSFSLLKLQDFVQAASILLGCKTRQEKNKIFFYS